MRVTSSMYYKNIQAESSRANERLFDVNKQISSGLKIQYAHDDIGVFTETMRLDNELTSLGQITKSAESGQKMSSQADTVLNEFQTTMVRTRVLLLQATNGAHSGTSRDAISLELRGLEEHLKNLSNTSVNGQFIFSGSAVDVRPISSDGTYMGNDVSMNAFVGEGVQQQYNLIGSDLFLGEEISVKREVTTNVIQTSNVGTEITGSTTMADYNGTLPGTNKHHFYLRGTQSDGTAFQKDIKLENADTIDTLLNNIGKAYGNGTVNVVNVSMNSSGQITIEDKLRGSSKLDFHMVGASNFNAVDSLGAGIANIDTLDTGTTDYATASGGTGSIFVREFVKSGLMQSDSVSTTGNNFEGLLYDRTQFSKNGSKLSSNTPQIIRDTNAFASPSTKISEVADLSQGTAGTLDGTKLMLNGVNIAGVAYDIQIAFNDAGSTFSYDSNNDGIYNDPSYNIFNADTSRTVVKADEMTYQQLMDVTNMIVTGSLPIANTDAAYDSAIELSNSSGNTSLSYDGKIQFQDINNGNTKASVALYDSNSGLFGGDSSVATFNSNNALTVRDPKTDFFKNLNEIITAVEDYKLYPDSQSGDIRSVGMENSIAMIDDLIDHVSRSQTLVGTQSNSLTNSLERVQLLEISTMTLRSSVIDTDLAEASLTLTQLSLSYQAMLSTVAKVSQLSLVNYL